MIKLLPLQLQFCESVAEIAKESLPEHWSLDAVRDVLRYDNNIYYVACNVEKSESAFSDDIKKADLNRESRLCDMSGTIVGFAGIMVVADEAELLNIAVTPSFRGRGIGQMLLDKMLTESAQRGTRRLLLEVRKSNVSAMQLYNKSRFVKLGERKNYYSHPKEDAVIMERKFTE